MTRAEKLLASRLLARAATDFARHVCNDTDTQLFAGMNPDERLSMQAGFNTWNSHDPKDDSPFDQIPDYAWMAYLAMRLGQEKEGS